MRQLGRSGAAPPPGVSSAPPDRCLSSTVIAERRRASAFRPAGEVRLIGSGRSCFWPSKQDSPPAVHSRLSSSDASASRAPRRRCRSARRASPVDELMERWYATANRCNPSALQRPCRSRPPSKVDRGQVIGAGTPAPMTHGEAGVPTSGRAARSPRSGCHRRGSRRTRSCSRRRT